MADAQTISAAQEAESLLTHPMLQECFRDVQLEAMRALVECNADDTTSILRFQAIATVIDAVQAQLQARAMAAKDGGGLSLMEPFDDGQPDRMN